MGVITNLWTMTKKSAPKIITSGKDKNDLVK
nr:MAG TPA: hypothetical protein [Bacteriophage sp.]DAF14524.1 MAG TPA: hypothetical protein [Crassvirales sp.]